MRQQNCKTNTRWNTITGEPETPLNYTKAQKDTVDSVPVIMLYRQVVPGNHPLNGWETWRRKDGLWICIDDPKGGWGCIDYDGNVKILLKYHLIIDGNTDLNAIVIMDQTGHAGVLRISGMKGINELAFKNKRTDERYPFFLITNTSGKFALFDKDLRQITEYKFIEWREGHAHRHPHYASRFRCSLQRF